MCSSGLSCSAAAGSVAVVCPIIRVPSKSDTVIPADGQSHFERQQRHVSRRHPEQQRRPRELSAERCRERPARPRRPSLTTIARNPRCMRASGVAAPTAVNSHPASAADTRLIPQPATIAATASAPARRRVGRYPTAHSTTTSPTARPRKRTYRFPSRLSLRPCDAPSSVIVARARRPRPSPRAQPRAIPSRGCRDRRRAR